MDVPLYQRFPFLFSLPLIGSWCKSSERKRALQEARQLCNLARRGDSKCTVRAYEKSTLTITVEATTKTGKETFKVRLTGTPDSDPKIGRVVRFRGLATQGTEIIAQGYRYP